MKILFNIYLSILGSIWISIHLYLRFFLKRSSYTLIEIKPFLTNTHYTFFALFIIFHLCLVSIVTIYLYKTHFKKKSHTIVIKLSKTLSYVIDILYWKPLTYIHDIIAPHIPYSGQLFLNITESWITHEYSKKYFYCLIFLFDILPKVVISSTFLIEIAIYNRIHYLLYMIILIIIPIGFSIFLKLMQSFAERILPQIKSLFKEIKGVKPLYNEEGIIVTYMYYEWTMDAGVDGVYPGNIMIKHIVQAEYMLHYVSDIKKYIAKVTPYITLLTSYMYVIGGIYRLVILLS